MAGKQLLLPDGGERLARADEEVAARAPRSQYWTLRTQVLGIDDSMAEGL